MRAIAAQASWYHPASFVCVFPVTNHLPQVLVKLSDTILHGKKICEECLGCCWGPHDKLNRDGHDLVATAIRSELRQLARQTLSPETLDEVSFHILTGILLDKSTTCTD
jgi:hypothetical protein